MDMPVADGMSLLAFGFDKETEDKLYQRWVGLAQYEVSFEEFKQKLLPVKVDEEKTLEKLDKLMDGVTWVKNNGNI
jgi:hypothetical protein